MKLPFLPNTLVAGRAKRALVGLSGNRLASNSSSLKLPLPPAKHQNI